MGFEMPKQNLDEAFDIFKEDTETVDTPVTDLGSVESKPPEDNISFAVAKSESYTAVQFTNDPVTNDLIRDIVGRNKVEFRVVNPGDYSVLLYPSEQSGNQMFKPFLSLLTPDHHYRVEIGMWVLSKTSKTMAIQQSRMDKDFDLYSLKEDYND